jgi:hypothetical protein
MGAEFFIFSYEITDLEAIGDATNPRASHTCQLEAELYPEPNAVLAGLGVERAIRFPLW